MDFQEQFTLMMMKILKITTLLTSKTAILLKILLIKGLEQLKF